MNLFLLSLLLAVSILIILFKLFGRTNTLRYHTAVDAVAMIGVPILALGSFNGLVVSIYSGILISALLSGLRYYYKIEEDPLRDIFCVTSSPASP